MSLYKRGGVWWYEFVFKGERIRASAHTSNKRVAEQVEAGRRTQLAKGEVGIHEPKRGSSALIFRVYAQQVIDGMRAKARKHATIAFYESKLLRILEFPRIADA